MRAIILAAGIGERLRPITDKIPKVMVEVGGKPCLQHNIELLIKYGVKEIAINTHYLPEKIREYFGEGKKFGVKIIYSYESEILGTSGALNNFKDFLTERFIVIYGDVIHQTDIESMLKFHLEKGGMATLALDNRNQNGRGVVVMDADHRILKFVEKPEEEIPGGLINSGIYILEPEIFSYIPEGHSDFGKEILPKLLREGEKIYGFETGKVIDMGNMEDLERARELFSQK